MVLLKGNVPAATDQTRGGVPSIARNAFAYGTRSVQSATDVVVIAGTSATRIATGVVAVAPRRSVTRTPKEYCPVSVRVPESTPAPVSSRPDGTAPESMENVSGAVPALAVSPSVNGRVR